MTASLVLAWRFDNGASSIVDFVADGEVTTIVREVAAMIDVIDGGAALWRGIAGDWERLYLEERSKRREMEELLGWAQRVTA